MESKEIQQLLDFIAKSPLDEISLETDKIKLSVKRHGQPAPVQVAAAPVAQTVAAPAAAAPVIAAPVPAATPKADNLIAIKSPMIGTFYRAANADSAAYIEIGSEVKIGQPVCIIEAMKLFNEIESEVAGRVVKVMVENATPVEYDQVLFYVEPM